MRSFQLTSTPFSWDAPSPSVQDRVGEILESWRGTKYMHGCQSRGHGVDCVRFIASVLDELLGTKTKINALPQDVSLHDPEKARAATRDLLRLYSPSSPVVGGVVNPGDIIVVGAGGTGPGHAMIVGHRKNTIWQSDTGVGVVEGGFGLMMEYQTLHRIYRLDNLEKRWLK